MALELRFTIPGQVERLVPIDQPHIKIGALLSNQVVLRAPGVDPIHALIEEYEDGVYCITDLGSATGVKVNGRLIDVEEQLHPGDSISIGSLVLTIGEVAGTETQPPVQMPSPPVEVREAVGAQVVAGTVRVTPEDGASRRQASRAQAALTESKGRPQKGAPRAGERQKDMLFSPRKARPSGDVLEVVAYWGDTVLDVELFHPTYKGFEAVTIGDPTKAHLIAAGKEHFDVFTLARFNSGGGYKVSLRPHMHARLRKGGKVEKINGAGEVSLGNRDIAHLKYGAVSYFLMFVRPPVIDLPKQGPTDPFFLSLTTLMMLLYFILVPLAWIHHPAPLKADKDDIWQVVQVPEQDKKPPLEKQKKPPTPKKPDIKVAQHKTPPKVPPTPPKPKDQVKPAKAVEKEKPKQPKPVEHPVPVKKPIEALTAAKVPTPRHQQAKPTPKIAQNNPNKSPGPRNRRPSNNHNKAGPLSKLKSIGMPSTGAKNPDFKLNGPKLANTALGKSGGVIGSGMKQAGAPRKGTGKASYKGVEGVHNHKASGVNLSKLGLGVGKIMSKTGVGAISTNFKDSAGGAGGGMGSASKTYGLGGVGSGKSLGLAGSGGAVNNFGHGSGGLLSGNGGRGGNGGAGLSGAFGGGGRGGRGGGGHGRANVEVPPGDPVVSGGLTAQEIMAVIRANLNQIRHCYEQLLQRAPNAAGKMSVAFVINTSGRVQSVRVAQSSISDSMMRGCVTGKIYRWAFPRPRGGQPVTVNYPFVFNPL